MCCHRLLSNGLSCSYSKLCHFYFFWKYMITFPNTLQLKLGQHHTFLCPFFLNLTLMKVEAKNSQKRRICIKLWLPTSKLFHSDWFCLEYFTDMKYQSVLFYFIPVAINDLQPKYCEKFKHSSSKWMMIYSKICYSNSC